MAPSLVGAFNFRDLGGLHAAGGQVVRSGVLFRSDTLQALTEQDVTQLVGALGVGLIVDLRGGTEAVEQGRGLLAGASVCYLNVPLQDAPVTDLDPAEQTLRFYEHTLASSAQMLAVVVRMLAAVAGEPAVLHCAAGKDRTGVVTALLLSLLDVEREEIVADYLATRHNMPLIIDRFRGWPRYQQHMTSVPPQLYEVDEGTIRAFLRHLDERYDGAAGWARSNSVPGDLLARLGAGLLRLGE